jgi:hypothetical protein
MTRTSSKQPNAEPPPGVRARASGGLRRPSAGSICRFVRKQRGLGLAKRPDLW